MKTPVDIIEEGITKGDWKKVITGFYKLTGKKLATSTDVELELKPKRRQKIKARKGSIDTTTPSLLEENNDPYSKFRTKPLSLSVEDEENEDIDINVDIDEEDQDDHKVCRVLPWEPPKGENKFVPDPNESINEMAEDKKWLKGRKPRQRRPQAQTVFKVKCEKCKKIVEAETWQVIGVKSGAKFVCPKCIKRTVKSH